MAREKRKKRGGKDPVKKKTTEQDLKVEDDASGPGGEEDPAKMADETASVETLVEPGAEAYDPDLYGYEETPTVIPRNPTVAAVVDLAPTSIRSLDRRPADERFKGRRDAIKARRRRKSAMMGRPRY